MPEVPPPPTPAGAQIIERIYRFATAIKVMHPLPETMRPALIITQREAFTLLDHLKRGPWQLSVWMPRPAHEGVRTVPFDLRVAPQPGVMWASVFGVALVIEDDVLPDDT